MCSISYLEDGAKQPMGSTISSFERGGARANASGPRANAGGPLAIAGGARTPGQWGNKYTGMVA